MDSSWITLVSIVLTEGSCVEMAEVRPKLLLRPIKSTVIFQIPNLLLDNSSFQSSYCYFRLLNEVFRPRANSRICIYSKKKGRKIILSLWFFCTYVITLLIFVFYFSCF